MALYELVMPDASPERRRRGAVGLALISGAVWVIQGVVFGLSLARDPSKNSVVPIAGTILTAHVVMSALLGGVPLLVGAVLSALGRPAGPRVLLLAYTLGIIFVFTVGANGLFVLWLILGRSSAALGVCTLGAVAAAVWGTIFAVLRSALESTLQ